MNCKNELLVTIQVQLLRLRAVSLVPIATDMFHLCLQSHVHRQVLILDGKMQSAEADEFVYHESLVHLAMLQHPK